MRHFTAFCLICAIAGTIALSACANTTATDQLCFNQVPVANVQIDGDNVDFTVAAAGKVSTFSVQKTAFGAAPATMKNGDRVSFCANQVETGGHVTITLSQFTVTPQIRVTSTP